MNGRISLTPQRHRKYDSNLEEARKFEDFAADVLYMQCGIPIYVYRSRHYQADKGENRAGFEIKYDKRCHETGNLFIETAESWSIDVQMKPAGIMDPRCVFYVIGNYARLWIFAATTLRNLCNDFPLLVTKIDTSEGVLLPVGMADRWAIKVIDNG